MAEKHKDKFGEEPERDWRDHSEIPDEDDEAEDSEDASEEDRAFMLATFGGRDPFANQSDSESPAPKPKKGKNSR